MRLGVKLQICTALCSLLLAAEAGAIETKAKNLILMDYDTGQYLYEKEMG